MATQTDPQIDQRYAALNDKIGIYHEAVVNEIGLLKAQNDAHGSHLRTLKDRSSRLEESVDEIKADVLVLKDHLIGSEARLRSEINEAESSIMAALGRLNSRLDKVRL